MIEDRVKISKILKYEVLESKDGVFRLKVYHDELLERTSGFLFGGAIAMLFDLVMGMAVRTINKDKDQVTIHLSIEFLRKAKSEYYIFEGRVVKFGRNIVFVEGRMFDKEGKLLAKASGEWFLISKETKKKF